jgi:hypothetical protein
VLVLHAVGLIALGTPPTASDSDEQVVTWFRDHRNGARWCVWAATVSIPQFARMFRTIALVLPAPHRDGLLIGAVIFVVTYAVQAWTWGWLALHAERLEPTTARALLDVAVF